MNTAGRHLAAAVLALGTTLSVSPSPAQAAPQDTLIQPIQHFRYYHRPYYRHGYYGYGPRFYHRPEHYHRFYRYRY